VLVNPASAVFVEAIDGKKKGATPRRRETLASPD